MMKKLINSILALSIAIAGFLSVSDVAVAAEDGNLKYSWNVTYTGVRGNAFTTNYDVNKANLLEIMPGDTVVYTAEYKNGTDKAADFYLSTEVFNTLEDDTTVNTQGGAYTFKIEDQGPSGNKVLYDNIIGGDATTTDPVGLKQLNVDGKSYFALGTVPAGESGKIVVTVAVDGNSQDDSYMAALAKMSIIFAAEATGGDDGHKNIFREGKHSVQKVAKSVDGKTEVVIIDEEVPTSGANPLTSDTTFPLIMCAVCFAVGVLFILWYFKLTQKQKEA